MTADLAETLPLPQRLALSYAPRAARASALTLLLLDQRLAAILRGGGQQGEGWAVLAQIKLAWWRDRLAEDPARWPQGEPLLALLRDFPGGPGALVGMVDGWEILLSERLDFAAVEQYSEGRAAGWATFGGGLAAQQWAKADLFLNLQDGEERDDLRALLLAEPWNRTYLPRRLRPLAVLHALAGRAMRRGAAELLDGPGAMLCAMRVGIFGR